MKLEKMQLAESLFMKTNLSKKEIAAFVGVSRRTIYHWNAEHNWERLKKSAQHMPSLCVENLWITLAKLQESILSPGRPFSAPTAEEIRGINYLGVNIRRLSRRCPLNETIELRNHFMDFVSNKKPELAPEVQDLIDHFIRARAKAQPGDFMGDRLDDHGCIPHRPDDTKEVQLDLKEMMNSSANLGNTDGGTDTSEDDDFDENDETPTPFAPAPTPFGFEDEEGEDEEDELESFGATWVKPEVDELAEYHAHISAQQQHEEEQAASKASNEAMVTESLEAELQSLKEELYYSGIPASEWVETQTEIPANTEIAEDENGVEVSTDAAPSPRERVGERSLMSTPAPQPALSDSRRAPALSSAGESRVGERLFMASLAGKVRKGSKPKTTPWYANISEEQLQNFNRRQRREILRLQGKLGKKYTPTW